MACQRGAVEVPPYLEHLEKTLICHYLTLVLHWLFSSDYFGNFSAVVASIFVDAEQQGVAVVLAWQMELVPEIKHGRCPEL